MQERASDSTSMATNKKPASELLRAQTVVFNDTLAYFGSMALNWANELGVADVVHAHGQPAITLSDLTAKLSIPPSNSPAVRRLMRLLVHKGYFAYHMESDAYSLTPLSEILIKGNPTSLSPWVHGLLDPVFIDSCHLFGEFCRRDHHKGYAPPFAMLVGMSAFESANENPELNTRFNEAMAADSTLTARALVEECGGAFEGLRSLVDVGGGNGTTARAIAVAFPHVKCSVYDLPHVIATAPESPLVEALSGNMFEHIPSADAVFMKLILHDWADEECVRILRLCKKAIPSREEGGKVMVVDIVMDADERGDMKAETQLYWDLAMLAGMEGKERGELEWAKIFSDAGFSGYKVTPLGVRSLIEAFP